MNRTLSALLAGTALVMGLAACGGPTEAVKVTSSPEISVSAPPTEESSAEVAAEPSAGAEAEIPTSFKVGDTAKIGEWEVSVTKIGRAVQQECRDRSRTADVGFSLTWKFGGSDAQVYDQAFIVTSSDGNAAPTEARPGGSLKLEVIFDVPVGAVKGGVITVEGYDESFDMQYADFAF